MKSIYVSSLFLIISLSAHAMEFSPIKLNVWTKGETVAGEEFIAATEAVADYLATLPRPTGNSLKSFKYGCQGKARYIRPDLQSFGSNPPINGWTEIRTIYDLKDCVAISD